MITFKRRKRCTLVPAAFVLSAVMLVTGVSASASTNSPQKGSSVSFPPGCALYVVDSVHVSFPAMYTQESHVYANTCRLWVEAYPLCPAPFPPFDSAYYVAGKVVPGVGSSYAPCGITGNFPRRTGYRVRYNNAWHYVAN